jgi:curved DNA-binding protein CbpA
MRAVWGCRAQVHTRVKCSALLNGMYVRSLGYLAARNNTPRCTVQQQSRAAPWRPLHASFFFSSFSSAARARRTHYQVLGISVDSTRKDVKSKFYELAKKNHPDTSTHGDPAAARKEFALITAAYEVLGDEGKRELYDRENKLGKYAPNPRELFGAFTRPAAPFEARSEGYRFDGVRPDHVFQNMVHNAHKLEQDVKKWIDWAFLDDIDIGEAAVGSTRGRSNRVKQRHRRQARKYREERESGRVHEGEDRKGDDDHDGGGDKDMWTQWRRMGGQREPRLRRKQHAREQFTKDVFEDDDLFAPEWGDDDHTDYSKVKRTGADRIKKKHKWKSKKKKKSKKK